MMGNPDDGEKINIKTEAIVGYGAAIEKANQEINDAAAKRDDMPELTAKAVILGIVLSIVLGAANAYLGLKVGMTVSASIPASVMSMAVLSLFESHTVLENNQVQTCAASGPSVTAGAIFTIPALLMSGYWQSFGYYQTCAMMLVGGILGILFTIPLRNALIVGGTLKFPEGVATATVLEAGAQAGDKVREMRLLGFSSAYGAISKLLGQGLGLWAEDGCQTALSIGKGVFYFGTDLSVALVGVGYIVGLNICCLCFAGGMLNWWIAIPLETSLNAHEYMYVEGVAAADVAQRAWSAKTRYLGVGAMTVGGLWALVSLRKELIDGLRAAVNGIASAGDVRSASRIELARSERDLPWQANHHARVFPESLMLVAAFLFSAVAAYMAGLVGSSNNPISGITISSILVCSLILYSILGTEAAESGASAAIVIGSMVCCAAAIGGDNMQDLKCGRLVGATPWKQQVSQIIGVVSGALVVPLVLELLRQAYGFEGAADGHRHPLPAPQAGLMQAVAQGVFERSLPWAWVLAGAVLAILCIAFDEYLSQRRCSWRCPVLAVAVGVYLPWSLTVPMMLGGIVAQVAAHRGADERAAHEGLLVSSGLITGEALAGVALAVPVAVAGRENVLYLFSSFGPAVVGLAVLLGANAGLAAIACQAPEDRQGDFAA
eukprot:TRINITY_DN17625_c0_g3_i2.p1 TRINITY_DN17625_c0_g3~~TRINITY_DN17625_c0_g3_i2.p1  ORF type:complete len:676 (+),score=113.28 TRINITY_DN17625_c0_g3_i2:42-2030(+)